ncbi:MULTISPECIES: hypothetical protein [Psychrobacter]|uniref:hypothetical protein n=1 Tax=Psychrobacter TaxID=497 RepID=UPI0004708AE1|nr:MULTISPECIES: hypothetical protein [Psychrobacter]
MKKTKVILHLSSFIFFTILFYILFLKDGELFDTNFFVFIAAYILFALAPLLSLALQYEVSKDNEFFNKFTSGTTKDFKMDDYLRISFLLFYNIGAYAGIQIRNKVLKKEYRKTDMRHIKIVNEILDRKKILLVILIIQLLITILLFSSYFFIR